MSQSIPAPDGAGETKRYIPAHSEELAKALCELDEVVSVLEHRVSIAMGPPRAIPPMAAMTNEKMPQASQLSEELLKHIARLNSFRLRLHAINEQIEI